MYVSIRPSANLSSFLGSPAKVNGQPSFIDRESFPPAQARPASTQANQMSFYRLQKSLIQTLDHVRYIFISEPASCLVRSALHLKRLFNNAGLPHNQTERQRAAISCIEDGIRDYWAVGARRGVPYYLTLKAMALHLANRSRDSLRATLSRDRQTPMA
jgi:hypothetical protein